MRKENRTYYFSVEGETEKWYLEWLQNSINADAGAKYSVKLDCKTEKNPSARVKGLTILGKTEITHVFDRESEDIVHAEQFLSTLNQMRKAEKLGKNVKYMLGYSNFTFELWLILHKANCNGMLTSRSQYLAPLKRAFEENFESMDQYKQKNNFSKVLNKLSLEDVRMAVQRSERIMQHNQESGYVLQKHRNYTFYKENPSLSLWETIKKILADCALL